MRKFTLLVALFATLSMSAKNLPFKIAGVRATEANLETLIKTIDAKDKYQARGKISYNEDNNTLYMDTFFVRTPNDIPGFELDSNAYITIYMDGDNWIVTDDNGAGVYMNYGSRLIITGPGNMKMITNNEGVCFLMGNHSALKVMYTTMELTPNQASCFAAEEGDAGAGIELTFNNSQVKTSYSNNKSSKKGYAVANIGKLNIEFSDVEFKPNGNSEDLTALRVSEVNVKMDNLNVENADKYTFSTADKNYMYDGKPARELKWARDLKDDKTLVSISGTINDGSKAEYKWDEFGLSGSVILRNDTLFLKSASIGDNDGYPAITLFKDKAVTIYLEGENKILNFHKNMAGIYSYGGVNFAGKGSLQVDGYEAGIMMQKGMYVKDAEVRAYGGKYGICNAKPEAYTGEWTLKVDQGADVRAYGDKKAIYLNTKKENEGLLLVNGTEIAMPYIAEDVYSAKEVRFATPEWKADVEIAGRTINSFNYNNLHEMLQVKKLDKKGEDSLIVYNKEYGTLSFTNVQFQWTEAKTGPFLKIGEKLTILVRGDNEVEMTNAVSFIQTKNDVTIQSNGQDARLVAYGISWGQIAEKLPKSGTFVQLEGDANLSISEVIATANAFEYGIIGAKEGTNKVYFPKAAVLLDVSKEATMEINDMSFTDCEISKPSGAAYSAELKGIAKDGKLVAGEQVLIRTKEEAIENIGQKPRANSQKLLQDGRLFIQLQDGTIYDATGRKQ
ncbi:MAG: carbohydrate-binding domain-containing protein [Paludibacteraceae bacterium]|nr:carbohydrate-binding domain-containing protein [Paludibacteraceae bacterium]